MDGDSGSVVTGRVTQPVGGGSDPLAAEEPVLGGAAAEVAAPEEEARYHGDFSQLTRQQRKQWRKKLRRK